ncbi:MAG: glycosyltransferase N-terminal domain-containing protein [Ferruginibacter sp.]
MSKVFYTIFLFLYSAGIRVAAIFNPKARLWLLGRRQFPVLSQNADSKTVWMHCASMGEFEQGRPVLEHLKVSYPDIKIVLSFFSPSGYEAAKNYTGANHIVYLPMDNVFAAKKFIAAVNPSLVLWVKYEYWFYYLQELKKQNIPVLLVSGIFRKDQPFFKWYGGIWKEMLQCFDHFFVQNEASAQMLATAGIKSNVTVSGDTRFDRVIEIAKQSLNNEIIYSFCKDHKVLVAGSTWEDDEVILASYGDETHHAIKMIIVPHELDAAHINSVKKMFKKSVCYTAIAKQPELLQHIQQYDTLIVDTIGMLSRLYSVGFINYIGGGFTNDGIHNILEAAVWGKPIIIGENYEKYFEAIALVDCGAAESITDTNELKEVLNNWINDAAAYKESAAAAKEYVYTNGGATNAILEYIQVKRLLTS